MRFALVWALLAPAVLIVAGCTDLAVRLGLRTRLDGSVPVSSISAALVSGRAQAPVAALGPGRSANLVIVAMTPDGRKLVTTGAGGGKVVFDSFLIESSIVTVGKDGKVSLPADPTVSEGKSGHVSIAVVGHPDVVTALDIPVRYDIAYQANFSGKDGAPGIDGTAGLDGMRGSDASPPTVDPATGVFGPQGAGGAGSDGGRGGDGSNGGDGSPGANVHIWMRLDEVVQAPSGHPLVQVKVLAGARQSLFLIDPEGGSLKVSADGGHGGRGGSGGRGGRGGSGGSGFPPGNNGSDGQSGFDGHAGSGGRAGTITLSVDPAAQPYLGCVSWSNRSGDGRPGPAPSITVEAVPPLW